MRMSTRTVRKLLLVGLAPAAVVACRPITGDDEIRRERLPGVVSFYGHPVVVEIPEAVDRGMEFQVTVQTFGGGCVVQGHTEVSLAAGSVEVRPYDIFVTRMPADYVCTDILNRFPHRATLRLDQPGTATIRVHGRAQPGDTPLVIERTVLVR
jgi:hypothetical protein